MVSTSNPASLTTSYTGLMQKEAEEKLTAVGLNEVLLKKNGIFKRLLKWAVSPITLMLLFAALLSFVLEKSFDFYFIISMIVLNIVIGFWHEKKADDAIQKLQNHLAVRINTKRDKQWNIIDSRYLVPDDLISLKMGDIIPADVTLLDAKNVAVNQSALTGESLPVEKKIEATCYAGTFMATGLALARVTATGRNTNFGKALITVEKSHKRSLLEQDILGITKYLTVLSLVAVAILSAYFMFNHKPLLELLGLDLSLIIAGIPVSLPTVMTLITSFGIMRLADQEVIVRKIASLENLANTTLLLTDKTGTLTKNEIEVLSISPYHGYTKEDVIRFAHQATSNEDDAINASLTKYIQAQSITIPQYRVSDFMPHDSERKRSTASIVQGRSHYLISVGAPQVIRALCAFDEKQARRFKHEIDEAGTNGYRPLVVAHGTGTTEETTMQLVGIILLSDVPRADAREIIDFMHEHGIQTKLITGDHHAISMRVADELGLEGKGITGEDMAKMNFEKLTLKEFNKIGVFSEVLPIDKYTIVEYAKKHYVVAVTGDGINDIPPIQAADVGISVKNGVDALKGVADIVILREGIAVIKDAIIESRKIYSRLYSYSVYRISESFRVIFNILLVGLIYREFPILPIQLIMLALLNDIPIISLAFNRVEIPQIPSAIRSRQRFQLGSIFGITGLMNSFLFIIIAKNYLHLDWAIIQTMFFLKLSVSGHLLIYAAHTRRTWYTYLPSAVVIWATTLTQLIATFFAYYGFLMHPIGFGSIIFVWLWSLGWMQFTDLSKKLIPSESMQHTETLIAKA